MSDIQPYGAGQGVSFYWIRVREQYRSHLQLVAIDEVGNVTQTSMRAGDDPGAPSQADALIAHLSPAIKGADNALKRHKARQEAEPAEDAPVPAPVDPATRQFFGDDD